MICTTTCTCMCTYFDGCLTCERATHNLSTFVHAVEMLKGHDGSARDARAEEVVNCSRNAGLPAGPCGEPSSTSLDRALYDKDEPRVSSYHRPVAAEHLEMDPRGSSQRYGWYESRKVG
eukprot:4303936-Prymnesium_polylepis.1